MNTRQGDLNKLEELRDRRGSKHANAIIEKVHRLSKDEELERLRKLMIEAQDKKDFITADRIASEIKRRWG